MTTQEEFAKAAMAAMIVKAPFFDAKGEHGTIANIEQFRADIAVSSVAYAVALTTALYNYNNNS